MKVLPMNDKETLKKAVAILKKGGAVVFPTDTSYGLAVDALNPKALEKIYSIKGRRKNMPCSIIPPTRAYMRSLAMISSEALLLMRKYWPGALTLILPQRKQLPDLISKEGGVAFRYPDYALTIALARALGRPITATSANRAGQGDLYDSKDIMALYAKRKNRPDALIDAGILPRRLPSTIVKINENGNFEILRQGSLKIDKKLFGRVQ